MNSNQYISSTRDQRLPPILARDYRRNVVWPIITGLTSFALSGAALGYIILIVVGIMR